MFYDIFTELCHEKGVSESKAAESIGLNRSAVVKWKKGASPASTTIQRMADYFGVSVDYLLGVEPKEGARAISDDELKFALWGDVDEIDDEDLEDVRRYAAFVKEKKGKK